MSKLFYKRLILSFAFLLIIQCDMGLYYFSNVNQRFEHKNDFDDYSIPDLSNNSNFYFLVISDTHYQYNQKNYLKKIASIQKKYQIEFVIINGDIVNNGWSRQYQLVDDDRAHLAVSLYPVLGNHDIYNRGFQYFVKYFGRSIYHLEFGNTLLIFLDTANGSLGQGQRAWLEDLLDHSAKENKLIFTHYSPLDGPFQNFTTTPYGEEKYYITSLCTKYNIDYYVSGHLHNYHRKQINQTTFLSINDAMDDDHSAYLFHINGTNINCRTLSAIF
ncbi:MAG: metallophosphoesterase [Spirochaetes bacterium]|nr:metallophosphoesterase [Spirochaetota bacterium]